MQRARAIEGTGEPGRSSIDPGCQKYKDSQNLQLIQAGPSEMLVSELAQFPTETLGAEELGREL